MNENINLCELLKGHEDEIFYSPVFGEIKLKEIDNDTIGFNTLNNDIYTFFFNKKGKLNVFCDTDKAECLLFPSKDQRDWDKWAEEHKPKTSKTWSELVDSGDAVKIKINTHISRTRYTGIEKSALALLKIYQLIYVSYGGVPTREERLHDHIVYVPDYLNLDKQKIVAAHNCLELTAFHTREQCEEFLSYSENVQLLKDFYMI